MKNLCKSLAQTLGGIAALPLLLVGAVIICAIAQFSIRFILLAAGALLVSWPVSRVLLGVWALLLLAMKKTPFFETYEDSKSQDVFAVVSAIVAIPLAVFFFIQSLDSTYWR